MNDIINGLTGLRHVALNGIAKTSLLSQHNLMPEHEGKVIKKLKYHIDKKKGIMIVTFEGGDIGMLNYNSGGEGEQKYVFDHMVVKTPGDINAAYRKDEKGNYQPYALQLDLVYHLDKD